MRKTNLKAVSGGTYSKNTLDRLHKAIAVLIFMSDTMDNMTDEETTSRDPVESNFGMYLTFSWLIEEMQGIEKELGLVKNAEREEA